MTPNEFLDLLAADEQRGVEFKNARARNDTNFPEVAKAVLGMTNRRDGGWILIGVEDRTRNIEGLSDEQVASWENPDPVREKLRQYADPDVWVDVEIVELDVNGKTRQCGVIRVREFEAVPVLCRKPATVRGDEVLRMGACYVRSRQMPATTVVADHAAFRELLELAVDKGVREFVRRSRQAELGDDLLAAQELFRRVGEAHVAERRAADDQERIRDQRNKAFES